MTNSPLIDRPAAAVTSPSDMYAFVSGERPDLGGAPEWLAWQLEWVAADGGWQEGRRLGSETELSRKFAVSRETLREAIRIVERRGSMRMVRGRFGGLTIACPDLRSAALALATYLHAVGCTPHQAREAVGVLTTLIADPQDHMLQLARQACDMLDSGELKQAAGHARAMAIAVRIMEANTPFSGQPVRLGSEWDLCERFATSRSVLRQALRVLADFDMLENRRGRGGGAFLKPPSPIGIIRQLFPWLAGERHDALTLMESVWVLNIAHVRLAARRLAVRTCHDRAAWREATASRVSAAPRKHRWILLMQATGVLIDNPLLDALVRAFVCYQARVARPKESMGRLTGMAELEQQLLDALGQGNGTHAERAVREAQQLLSDALMTSMGAELIAPLSQDLM